jgi:hypothetical protein
MNKTILVGLAILAVSATTASATPHRSLHSRAVIPNEAAAKMTPKSTAATTTRKSTARALNANASIGTPAPAPILGGGSPKDHEMYMKNLRDAGYDPKNDFTKTGTLRQQ